MKYWCATPGYDKVKCWLSFKLIFQELTKITLYITGCTTRFCKMCVEETKGGYEQQTYLKQLFPDYKHNLTTYMLIKKHKNTQIVHYKGETNFSST